jgi:hypothetical protein
MEKAMSDTDQASAPPPSPETGWDWAIVEIMGHRKHAGRVREVEKFGTKMLRIDVPIKGDAVANGWETLFYGGLSIFSFVLTDEAAVMSANKPYDPAYRYRLPAPGTPDDDTSFQEDDDEAVY